MTRRLVLCALLVLTFSSANANAHGPGKYDRSRGRTVVVIDRVEPSVRRTGRGMPGHAKEITEALASESSEWQYRGRLCGELGSWSAQRACLAHRP
jgi:hypothetical protein